MSSTLDLNKVLDQILETIERVTPYDGANVLFVESDLVHVVRQRGYVEKDREKEWLAQQIPMAKLAVLQQIIDFGKPLAIPDISASPMRIGFPGLDWIHSNIIVPIRLKDKVTPTGSHQMVLMAWQYLQGTANPGMASDGYGCSTR